MQTYVVTNLGQHLRMSESYHLVNGAPLVMVVNGGHGGGTVHQPRTHFENLYRLVIGDDGPNGPHVVEFEGRGAEAALLWASRHCIGHEVEVFENGRSLGVLSNENNGGYWVILAPRAEAARRQLGEARHAPRGLTIGLATNAQAG